jgi:hypothetical protein
MGLIVERPPIASRAVIDGWATTRLPRAGHAVTTLGRDLGQKALVVAKAGSETGVIRTELVAGR